MWQLLLKSATNNIRKCKTKRDEGKVSFIQYLERFVVQKRSYLLNHKAILQAWELRLF